MEWVHARFVLWNHVLVVHHPALAALWFGLVLNWGARRKCPHTRSPPGQRGCVLSPGEHLCCRCVCFNYVVTHVVYSLYLTLKTESNLLTFSLPEPKQCNPTSSEYTREETELGEKKKLLHWKIEPLCRFLILPLLGFSHTTFISLISPWSSPCFSQCPADVPPGTHPALQLSHPGRAGATSHMPAWLNLRPIFFLQ